MNTKTIWLPVIDTELSSFYEVSNTGLVRSIPNVTRYRPNQKPTILKHHISKYGYCQVTLTCNGCRYLKRVNRLVAQAFIPNPENKPVVNHENGIKTDNNVKNLTWATYSENEIHSYEVLKKNIKGYKKTYKCGVNTKSRRIKCHETGITYDSISEAARQLNVYTGNIEKQVIGELKKTGGYTFEIIL